MIKNDFGLDFCPAYIDQSVALASREEGKAQISRKISYTCRICKMIFYIEILVTLSDMHVAGHDSLLLF